MRRTAKGFLAWRGLPLLAALLTLSATVGFLACDDSGPSPIGEHEADEVDSGGATPSEDAAAESAADAEPDAGEDPDSGEEQKDSGVTDASDAGDGGDGGKKRDADAS